MITSSHLLLYELIEDRMAKKPIPVKNLRLTKSGKLEKVDKGASHPVVKARRKRTKGKVTGVRAAK